MILIALQTIFLISTYFNSVKINSFKIPESLTEINKRGNLTNSTITGNKPNKNNSSSFPISRLVDAKPSKKFNLTLYNETLLQSNKSLKLKNDANRDMWVPSVKTNNPVDIKYPVFEKSQLLLPVENISEKSKSLEKNEAQEKAGVLGVDKKGTEEMVVSWVSQNEPEVKIEKRPDIQPRFSYEAGSDYDDCGWYDSSE